MKTAHCQISYSLPKKVELNQRTTMFTVEKESDAINALLGENLWKETVKIAEMAGGLSQLSITFMFGDPVDDHHLPQPKKYS